MPSSDTTGQQVLARDPDARLMLQVGRDEPGAFEQLVERYQHRLVAVLERAVRRPELAEDLAQEVFLRVYRSRKSYRPKAKFSTWLFTIANNLALNALRDRGRNPEVSLNVRESGPLGPRPAEQLAKAESGEMPDRNVVRAELQQVVQAAIDSLNERQRMAVMLNKFEDMGYAEIGEVMGLSPMAVKSLLARARSHLREALEPYLRQGQWPAI